MAAWFFNFIYSLEPYLQFPYILAHILDISIVAFVLYELLLLIKQTRAEQVLKGLAILVFIYLVSTGLHFNTISWILNETIGLGITAAIIVFQPELRKALEQIGRGRVFERAMLVHDDEVDSSVIIEEIINAVENMANEKIGALIVIERKTGLNDIIETGVKVDAVLTQQLMENIFVPNTPLHDGAIVIRRERISAAGCFLPLTENPNLSKQLGTRHRAALGISENSDALAIIVSEETGVISLAREGKLTRYLDSKGLKEILDKVYKKEKESRPFNLMRWRSKDE